MENELMFRDIPKMKELKETIDELQRLTQESLAEGRAEGDDVEHLELFMGVIENLQEIIFKGKNIEEMSVREKANFIAHFMMFEDMLAAMDEEEDYDDFDEDEEFEEEEE